MAQEDYISGSQFGTLAGSLLASNKKRDKKERNRALLATILFESLGALQKQQKQKIVDGVNDIKENYNDAFQIRESDYRAKDSQRAEYQEYLKDPDIWVNNTAERAYNNIDFIKNEGAKWGTPLETESLREASQALYNSKVEEAKLRAIELSKDKMITESSFGKYNQVYLDEYKALRNQVRDDPSKKGLVKQAFNKIFGYGASEIAELQLAVQEAKDAKDAYINNTPTDTVSPDKEDDTVISTYANEAKKIDAEFLTNFSNELINRNDLKNRRNKIIKTASKPNYQLTAEDAEEIILTGAKVPSLPQLNNFTTGQAPAVVSTILEKRALELQNPNVDPFDFMSYPNQQIAKDLYNYEGEATVEEYNEQASIDTPTRLQTISTIENLIASYKDSTDVKEKEIYKKLSNLEGGNFNKEQKGRFISNVIKGKVVLQDILPGQYQGINGEADALKESIKLQLDGVKVTEEKRLFGRINKKSTSNYIDVKIINTPLNNTTAQDFVDALNGTPILREVMTKKSGKDWSLKENNVIETTASETKLDYGLRFYTVSQDKNVIDPVTKEKTTITSYSWDYQPIDK